MLLYRVVFPPFFLNFGILLVDLSSFFGVLDWNICWMGLLKINLNVYGFDFLFYSLLLVYLLFYCVGLCLEHRWGAISLYVVFVAGFSIH